MKLQRNVFKWAGVAFLFAVFMSFGFLLSSVSAQEGDATPTPSETLPSPEVTPEPFVVPELEQEVGAQGVMSLQSVGELGGDWAAQVNISDTEDESSNPMIAADGDGDLHIVWQEMLNGKQEIFYTWINADETQAFPVNVSENPSFNSVSPQLVVDSVGRAHIVWQEEDNDHPDDFETLYSRCDGTGCSTPTR